MDIEKPQGINLLAKELKEHGIACSFDEAYQKAQSMIMATENKKTETDEKLQLLEQRYKFLLNSQNEKLSGEINNLKNILSSISSELIGLKRQINEQKQAIKQQEQRPKETQQKITSVDEKKETKEVDLENLKPEDVSIEKFFYFGEK
jgi:chromosome segregation ATPase